MVLRVRRGDKLKYLLLGEGSGHCVSAQYGHVLKINYRGERIRGELRQRSQTAHVIGFEVLTDPGIRKLRGLERVAGIDRKDNPLVFVDSVDETRQLTEPVSAGASPDLSHHQDEGFLTGAMNVFQCEFDLILFHEVIPIGVDESA